MKLKLKRSAGNGASPSAVLDAPEESFASRADVTPAPAGTLHRAYVGGYAPDPEEDTDAAPERSRSKFFGRDGLLGSKSGRIFVGAGLFFCVGAAAAMVFGTRNYLLHDERFVVPASADIQISGNEHMTRAQLLSVFGADVERNIFRVPLAERRADLERLPWVAHATVMRLLPNRLRVVVTEREPVAFVRQGTNIGLVDAEGVLLDMPANVAGDPKYSFPVLTGLSEEAPLSTRAARMEIYRDFMKSIDRGGERLSEKVSEVDVTNPEDVKAMVADSGADILVHFGDEDFLARFQKFEQHLAEWRTQYPKLASADMRYERQIVLEMQPGTGIPLSAADTHAAPDAAGPTATADDVAPAAVGVPKTVSTKTVSVKTAALKPVAAKKVPAMKAAPVAKVIPAATQVTP